jgi:serine/threonine protein kinase
MIGKTILHYNILEKVGEGGMGVVYLAEDTKLERQVAFKFLPHHITGNSDVRKRFEIEAKAAAALNHPNITTIYNIEEADDKMFIVMEYIAGRELKEEIRSGKFETERAVKIAIQIAEGLPKTIKSKSWILVWPR